MLQSNRLHKGPLLQSVSTSTLRIKVVLFDCVQARTSRKATGRNLQNKPSNSRKELHWRV